MAFECQQNTEIGLENTSTNCFNNYPAEKGDLDHFGVINKREIKALDPDYQDTVPKSDVKIEIPLDDHIVSFSDLPPALVSEILNFLDPKVLGIVSCVSTLLYRLASEHQVWKDFYYERWGYLTTAVSPGSEYPNEKPWKELFVEREFRTRTFMGRYSIETLFGHTEAVRAVFVLTSKKLIFTSGYDQVVRMWDMEEGLALAASRPLGCTVRAIAADTRFLIAGGTDGFIHGWKVENGNPHLFDIRAPQNQNMEFRVWEHEGPVTCLALDSGNMYSGSWDMTIRIWDRSSLKCFKVLVHNDWVWNLVPHDMTIGSTAGSHAYIWEINTGNQLAVVNSVHSGNTYSMARSHTGKLLFTGGEDGSIHMFEFTRNVKCKVQKIATWIPHTGPVYSLAFEFPWLVSASSDGKISLIDVRKLLKTGRHSLPEISAKGINCLDPSNTEPPQRMLHGLGCNLFSVGIGSDRIVCGGEGGVVRIWNFSQALEIEQRVRALRGIKLENRMRRRKLHTEISSRGNKSDQCSVGANENQISGNKNGWHNERRISEKLKA